MSGSLCDCAQLQLHSRWMTTPGLTKSLPHPLGNGYVLSESNSLNLSVFLFIEEHL